MVGGKRGRRRRESPVELLHPTMRERDWSKTKRDSSSKSEEIEIFVHTHTLEFSVTMGVIDWGFPGNFQELGLVDVACALLIRSHHL